MTAKVSGAPGRDHARYAILVPSTESTKPAAEASVSAAKMPEASQDLERFLFGLQQRWRICANATQRVCPLRTLWTLRVEPERGRVEKYPFSFNLLDHRPFRQH